MSILFLRLGMPARGVFDISDREREAHQAAARAIIYGASHRKCECVYDYKRNNGSPLLACELPDPGCAVCGGTGFVRGK